MTIESNNIKFLDRNPPELAVDEIRELAVKTYGLTGEIQQLTGERDQNHLITNENGDSFVLKIANSEEELAVIDFQLTALKHIAAQDPSLPVPRVVTDRQGRDYSCAELRDGSTHIVHLLSYLDGVPLAEVTLDNGVSTHRGIGALLARLDLALRGFFHPAADQQHPWNVETCARFLPLTRHIEDVNARKMIGGVLANFSEDVLPIVRSLRHQVIHQDAHAENLLVDPQDPQHITGIIDFGDMLYGSLVTEIAVASDCLSNEDRDLIDVICEIAAGFDNVLTLEDDEIDLVFDMVLARNALTVTIAAARAALTPEQPAHVTSAQPYVDIVGRLLDLGRHDVTRRLRAACRFPAYCPMTPAEASPKSAEDALLAKRYRLLGRKTTHFYARPQHFERGRGPWLYSTDGTRYLDCYNNVPQVGHCHPHVVKTISRQLSALNTNTRYLYTNALEYADRLTAKFADHLDACIFVNSGSEANDVAWQMAQLVTGNSGALIMEDAYHGITEALCQFSPGHPDTELPAFLRGLLVPDPYRGPFRDGDPDLVSHYSSDADRALADLSSHGHGLAAFMVDSAFCSSGVPNVPDGYLRNVEDSVRKAGGLMICDEVQSGFGRMGQWWGHEHHGVRADIVTLGKPVGNGYPLGVVVTSSELLNRFIDETKLFSTFGGNTVACAAGCAVLDVIEREDLIANARETGDYLRSQLRDLAKSQPLIGDIRGHGMLTGLEFVTDRETRAPATEETLQLLELMRQNKVLVGKEGRDNNILKLRPPLVFQPKHVEMFVGALDKSLSALRTT